MNPRALAAWSCGSCLVSAYFAATTGNAALMASLLVTVLLNLTTLVIIIATSRDR